MATCLAATLVLLSAVAADALGLVGALVAITLVVARRNQKPAVPTIGSR